MFDNNIIQRQIAQYIKACHQFAELKEKSPIFEHRSGVYFKAYVSNEAQKIGDFYQDSVELMTRPSKLHIKNEYIPRFIIN